MILVRVRNWAVSSSTISRHEKCGSSRPLFPVGEGWRGSETLVGCTGLCLLAIRSLPWQGDTEGRSTSALHQGERSPVLFHHLATDLQPQTGALRFRRKEWLEQAISHVRRDPWPIVLHCDAIPRLVPLTTNNYLTSTFESLDCIGQ